jgi:hypothetical protein
VQPQLPPIRSSSKPSKEQAIKNERGNESLVKLHAGRRLGSFNDRQRKLSKEPEENTVAVIRLFAAAFVTSVTRARQVYE